MKNIKRIWLPAKLPDLAVWFANFTLKFGQFNTALGFTAADLTAVEEDNATIAWLAAADEAFDSNHAGFRLFRDETLFGEKNSLPPLAPVTTLPAAPATLSTTIIERLVNMAERIKLSAGYSTEIGELLGIADAPKTSVGGGAHAVDSLKPTIKVEAATSGYQFSLTVSRLGMDSFKVQVRRMESEQWQNAAFGTSSPMDVIITPTVAGQPERIQVRAILLSRNEPVGEPSDPTYVTVNP